MNEHERKQGVGAGQERLEVDWQASFFSETAKRIAAEKEVERLRSFQREALTVLRGVVAASEDGDGLCFGCGEYEGKVIHASGCPVGEAERLIQGQR